MIKYTRIINPHGRRGNSHKRVYRKLYKVRKKVYGVFKKYRNYKQ